MKEKLSSGDQGSGCAPRMPTPVDLRQSLSKWRDQKGRGGNEKDDAVAIVITETLEGLKNPGAVQALTGKTRRQAAALERGARGDDAPSRSLHALITQNGKETETCLVLTSCPRNIGRKCVGASRCRLMLSRGEHCPDKFRPARSRSWGRGGDEQVFDAPRARSGTGTASGTRKWMR